jgi:hypothetical protein
MKIIFILMIIGSFAFADSPECFPYDDCEPRSGDLLIPNERIPPTIGQLQPKFEPPPPVTIQCKVVNENPDAWKWAAGGFLAATAIWALYFYKKN